MSIIGSLEDLSLADIIQVISGSQKTGVLYVNTSEGRSSIVFKSGYVVSASKPDLAHRLGQLLLKRNEISEMDLEICLNEQNQTDLPLGEILLKRLLVTPEKIRSYMKQQVVETINEIVNLKEGSFSFQTNAHLPPDLVLFDPQHILLDVAYLQDTNQKGRTGHGEESFSPSKLIAELAEEEREWVTERPTRMSDARIISLLRELTEELARPRESTEVSLLILRFAGELFDRCLFFVVSDESLVACGGFGFSLRHIEEHLTPMRISVPLHDASIFRSVYETKQSYRGSLLEGEWGKGLLVRISDRLPNEIVVLPVVSQGQVIAVLYGDNGDGQLKILSTDLLEVLLFQAGMALENSILRERLFQLTRSSEKALH